MKRFTLKEKNSIPCSMALGFFDGVHLGHKAVIEKAVSVAKDTGLEPSVFTFTAGSELSRKTKNGEIYSLEKRLSLIGELGVSFALVPEFKEFSTLSPSEFVQTLGSRFNVKAVCCGDDFRFGIGATGDVSLLKELCSKLSIEVYVVNTCELDGLKISSSEIRKSLSEGNLDKAFKMLGRAFSIEGRVVSGEHIGRKKLYPTINQKIDENFPLKRGVYASKVLIDGKIFPAVSNIGVCPTVKCEGTQPTCETYILDTSLELYGKSVEVFFEKFLRNEKKFASAEKLKAQITQDIIAAKEIL